jgi:methane/ammonia monooxygenase subunit C
LLRRLCWFGWDNLGGFKMTMADTYIAAAAVQKEPPKKRFSVNLFGLILAMGATCATFVAYRMYQQAYAWKSGLDATSAEFQTDWMSLLQVQLPVLFGICFVVWTTLFLTRDRNLSAITPEVELKRYFTFTCWLVAYTFPVYFTGSFFAEHDGVWHQTVLRDTPFSPSHIVLFYACIPIYLMFGIGSFIYAMTRLPAFAKGISVMHVFAVAGPFLILPNLGYNEWGHAYWLTEEIFSHPLHWGFVVLGWNGLALAGVLMQIVHRMRELFPIVFAQEAAAARAA